MRDQDLPQSAPKPNADEERVVLLKDINVLCQQLTALSNDATSVVAAQADHFEKSAIIN